MLMDLRLNSPMDLLFPLCLFRTFTGSCVGPGDGPLGSSPLGGGCGVVVGRKASRRGSVELAVNVLTCPLMTPDEWVSNFRLLVMRVRGSAPPREL